MATNDGGQFQEVRARFGGFGGRYVPEALWAPLEAVSAGYRGIAGTPEFRALRGKWLHHRLGRPTPLTALPILSEKAGGAQIWAKREDLLAGGSFCATSALTQTLLAQAMGKREIYAESATGDFGVALGTVAAALGIGATVFMRKAALEGEVINARFMKRLGVEVVPVDGTGRGRSQAMGKALRCLAQQWKRAAYATSSLASPAPYPWIVARSLEVIGEESVEQAQAEGIEVEYVIAPVGSGSFAAGLFGPWLTRGGPQLVGVQSGGSDGQGRTAASLVQGRPGVFLGTRSMVLQDEEGQVLAPNSQARGLAMPVAGPQHARWLQQGRVHYVMVDDAEAQEARQALAHLEGILISREAACALAYALKVARTLEPDAHLLVGISGAGQRELMEEVSVEDEGSGV